MNKRKIMYGVIGVVAFVFGGLLTRDKVLEGVEIIEVKYLGREPLNPPAPTFPAE